MFGSNPLVAVGLGVVLIVISFLVPGSTRDLILRVAGVLVIVVGVAVWIARRRQ